MGFDDPNSAAAAKVGLKDYDTLVDAASKRNKRLEIFVMNDMQMLKHG